MIRPVSGLKSFTSAPTGLAARGEAQAIHDWQTFGEDASSMPEELLLKCPTRLREAVPHRLPANNETKPDRFLPVPRFFFYLPKAFGAAGHSGENLMFAEFGYGVLLVTFLCRNL